ncbi:MAG: hypothetical protein AB8H03_21750 [Saprospiraceae bacterium]
MKNEILDNNFNSKLRNQLEVGEKVIWEGSPYKNRYTFLLILLPLTFILEIAMENSTKGLLFLLVSAIISFLWALKNGEIEKFFARKYNKYLITNQRIIFQTRKNKQLNFQSIPFEDITYPSVYTNMLGRKNGTIFLNIKKKSSTSLILKDLKTSIEEDNRPALEMIDHAKEVSEYIKLGIEKKL